MGGKPEAFDVLEFGEALIAARPRLRQTAAPLTQTPEEADRLVERTLRMGWRERRSFHDGDGVAAWLAARLNRRH